MTPMNDLETRRIRAEEAKQFMRNPLFKAAFDGVKADLDQTALACDPDNKDKAQRIVIAQQLLQAVRREIERRAEDGDFVEFQMRELQPKGAVRRLFTR
jgi:hypothetical protein